MSSSRQSLRSKPLRGGGSCPTCGAKQIVLSTEDLVLRVRGRRYRLDGRAGIHLGLPTAAPHLRAPPDPPDALAAHQPRQWSYEPLG